MDYNKLKIKEKYKNQVINDGNRQYILNDELTASNKKYIYNLITKKIFDYDEKSEVSNVKNVNFDEKINDTEIVFLVENKEIPLEEIKVKKKRSKKNDTTIDK